MPDETKKTGPFNSLREFMDAIEDSGSLLRIKEIDQDQIICGPCQDELDGRWDHFRQIKDEIQ